MIGGDTVFGATLNTALARSGSGNWVCVASSCVIAAAPAAFAAPCIVSQSAPARHCSARAVALASSVVEITSAERRAIVV